jgi:hypothetical protein
LRFGKDRHVNLSKEANFAAPEAAEPSSHPLSATSGPVVENGDPAVVLDDDLEDEALVKSVERTGEYQGCMVENGRIHDLARQWGQLPNLE